MPRPGWLWCCFFSANTSGHSFSKEKHPNQVGWCGLFQGFQNRLRACSTWRSAQAADMLLCAYVPPTRFLDTTHAGSRQLHRLGPGLTARVSRTADALPAGHARIPPSLSAFLPFSGLASPRRTHTWLFRCFRYFVAPKHAPSTEIKSNQIRRASKRTGKNERSAPTTVMVKVKKV